MSNLFFERARRMMLKLPQDLSPKFVENTTGVIGAVDCDRVIKNLSDKDFIDLVKRVVEAWKRRKKDELGKIEIAGVA